MLISYKYDVYNTESFETQLTRYEYLRSQGIDICKWFERLGGGTVGMVRPYETKNARNELTKRPEFNNDRQRTANNEHIRRLVSDLPDLYEISFRAELVLEIRRRQDSIRTNRNSRG